MADPKELFDAGHLEKAAETLASQLRSDPADASKRLFLFEVLVLLGQFDRAAKHLDVVGRLDSDLGMAVWSYVSACQAEGLRHEMYDEGSVEGVETDTPRSGTLNGKPFTELVDADGRLSACIEAFVSGQYIRIPIRYVQKIEMEEPRYLRDLFWPQALVYATEEFDGVQLGRVVLPALYPGSFESEDPAVVRGAASEWIETPDGGFHPRGPRILLVDGEPLPFLGIRELQFDS